MDLICGAHSNATGTCRGCRPQSEVSLASLWRDKAASQPEVSSSGTSSGSADCRGRKMKRQASRLPVPRGRPRDPAGFQVTSTVLPVNQEGGCSNGLAESLMLSCRQHPLGKAGRLPAKHCPHVVCHGSTNAHTRLLHLQGQGEHLAEAMTAASLQEPAMPASEDAGLDGHAQSGGSWPAAGGLGLDTVALLRELQKRNTSPQSAAAGAEGLPNPFEAVMRAAVKTEEASAKRFKEGSPLKSFGSVLLGSSGSRLPPSLQASLSELGLP